MFTSNEFRVLSFLIFTARSEVFKAMIDHDENKEKIIHLETSYSFEAMSALINFIYTAKTSNISPIAEELLEAADYVWLITIL